jgi:hypothetical protein
LPSDGEALGCETAADFFAGYRARADGKGLLTYLETVPDIDPEEIDKI